MADIKIELGVDDRQVKRGAESAKTELGKAGTEGGRRFDANLNRSAGRGLRRLALAAAAAGAAIGAALFSRASIRAAFEQQDAVNQLNSALFQTGQFSEETSRSLQDFASEVQRVTRFGDEAVLAQLAYSQSLGATVDQSKQLITASADLAAALGVDLASANRQLTQTLGGTAGTLGRIIPELRGLTEEQLRAGAGIDIISEKFAGFAERDASSLTGQIQQAKNAFGDLQEEIGFLVTRSPGLSRATRALTDGFVALQEVIKNNEVVLRSLVGDVFAGIISASQFVVRAVNGISTAFIRLQGLARDTEISASLNNLRRELRDIEELNGRFRSIDAETRRNLIQITQDQIAALEQERDVAAFANQERILSLDEIRDKILQVGDDIKSAIGESEEEGSIFSKAFNIKPDVDELEEDSDRATKAIFKVASQVSIIQKSLVAGVSQSIQSLGASLVTGENFFKSFLGVVLNALGDLLIAFGTGAIATGITAEAIRASLIDLVGGRAIVAGVAAIAAGGALKAFAGSVGASGAGGPSLATPTATSSGGVVTGDSFEAPLSQEERRADQSVQIVVQGDILDSEDTGRRLLDIFNENFRSDNSALVDARFA